jgi:hypothetical protein
MAPICYAVQAPKGCGASLKRSLALEHHLPSFGCLGVTPVRRDVSPTRYDHPL